MTTLITIPNITALHIPTRGSTPLPLSTGDLILTLLPANPPSHPSQTLTLTIGAASFPLLPISPVRKVEVKEEHPSFVFSPVPADGGEGIGQVKIQFKASTSQDDWEITESHSSKFQEILKAQGVWDERVLFVDDDDDGGIVDTRGQGWGEAIGGAFTNAGQVLATRLGAYTDRHVTKTDPSHPAPPSDAVASSAHTANTRTASIASSAESISLKIGSAINEGGKKVGSLLPDYIAKPSQPVEESEKGDIRKVAEQGWFQIAAVAKGVASAATTVGGALSKNAHRAVEHNFGEKAESVAQDVGQTGANIGSTGLAALKGTSVIVQGTNAGTGIVSGVASTHTAPATASPTIGTTVTKPAAGPVD